LHDRQPTTPEKHSISPRILHNATHNAATLSFQTLALIVTRNVIPRGIMVQMVPVESVSQPTIWRTTSVHPETVFMLAAFAPIGRIGLSSAWLNPNLSGQI
jgi:hypothetical protein